MQGQHTPHRKHIYRCHPNSASLTWDKHYSFFINVTKEHIPLGSVSEAGMTGCDLPNAFISSCIFPGKGRMLLDLLNRNPSSAFWQQTKVGTCTKKLGVASMQCRNESGGKAPALLRCKCLYPTHCNKEQGCDYCPSQQAKGDSACARPTTTKTRTKTKSGLQWTISHIRTWAIYEWCISYKVAIATSQDIRGVRKSSWATTLAKTWRQ